MLKMACRSRSKLATKSSESVFVVRGCIMTMTFGQFATYEVLRCGLGEVLPKKMAGDCFSTERKGEA